MKTLLLVSYYFPPRPQVGAVRPAGLAKYLGEFGWDVIVLTPELPSGQRPPVRIVETGYCDVLDKWRARFRIDPKRGLHQQLHLPLNSKMRSHQPHTAFVWLVRSLLLYPDGIKGWLPFAVKAARKLFREQPIDALVTTSPPITAHLIGHELKKVFKCPWIADFRDLWTQNIAYSPRIFLPFEKRLEKRTLSNADMLVAVSDPWADKLRQRYQPIPVHTISNGFDPDEFAGASPRLTDVFSITYTGQLYRGQRDPSPFLEALGELISEGALQRNKVKVRFFGPAEPWLPKLISDYGLSDVIALCGTVGRQEAIRYQRESQILLLLGWHDRREVGQHTGKLFEYLGSQRPILAVGGGRGVLTEVLEATEAGLHALSKQQIREYLIQAYAQFRETGEVRYQGIESEINRYTHREMSRQYAQLLDSLTPSPAGIDSPIYAQVPR
ncbi:MAG TPA: glycosyltransferase [Terriglobales bacterium]|nr:glycosyltransferase [Terriglobales bacterium]